MFVCSLPLSEIFILQSLYMRPNKALQRTPLRVDRDRGHFERRIRFDSITDLSVRRR